MAVVRYRSCTIDDQGGAGPRASSILQFRENLAGITASVQSAIDKLNGTVRPAGQGNQEVMEVLQPGEKVELSGQTPATLAKMPTARVTLTQYQNQSGVVYRGAPRLAGDASAGMTAPLAYGLYGTADRAAGQWNFVGEAAGGTAQDSTQYGRHARPVGLLAPGTTGPLGSSRTFGPGYLEVPTGVVVGDISQSGMAWRHDMAAWAWIHPADLTNERPVLSFSSPAPVQLTGTVLMITGSPVGYTVTGSGTAFTTELNVRDRIAIGQDPSVYEVVEIMNATTIKIVAIDPLVPHAVTPGDTILRGGPLPGMPGRRAVPPEARNTLYGLSVRPDGVVRVHWHVRQGRLVEALGPTITAGADWFVGFQRRERPAQQAGQPVVIRATGSFTIENRTSGFDFNTITAPGQWVRLDREDDWRQVQVITGPPGPGQTLTVDTRTGDFPEDQQCGIRTLRVQIHAGDATGQFTSSTIDGLPGPSGGTEAVEGNSGLTGSSTVCLGKLKIGRDERQGLTFSGPMDCVSMYLVPLDDDSSGDQAIKRHWALAYPDFIQAGQQVRRSPVSDIPDPATVWAEYRFQTAVAGATDSLDRLDEQTGGVLASLDARTPTTNLLAQTIGAPVPSDQENVERMAQQFGASGVVVAGGLILTDGTDDLTAYAALCRTVGGSAQADLLLDGKARGSFILIAIAEDIREQTTLDACGQPVAQTVVTERVVGINQTLWQAALAGGFQDVKALKLRLWWVGAANTSDAGILQLRAYGLDGDQISAAITVQSTDTLEVRVIPRADVGPALRDLGFPEDAIDTIVERPDGALPLVNLAQTPDRVARRYLEVLNGPPGQTVDGDPNPRNPALELARITDLARMFPPVPVDTVDQECAALAAVLTDAFACVTDVMNRVQAACVPFQLRQAATIGTAKLAVQRYIPCVANVSFEAALPPFQIRLNLLNGLFRLIEQETARVERQVQQVVDQARVALCVPRTLIAALRGGVCGIETPKEIADRQCPAQIDLLMDQLERALVTADLTLRKIAEAASQSTVDVELAGGASSQLAVDASIPCVGPVAALLRAF